MIEHQQNKYSWTFIFLGANMDAVDEAATLGIKASHSHTYTANSVGTASVYAALDTTVKCIRDLDFAEAKAYCDELVDNVVATSLSFVK
jgi:hypothetical protein